MQLHVIRDSLALSRARRRRECGIHPPAMKTIPLTLCILLFSLLPGLITCRAEYALRDGDRVVFTTRLSLEPMETWVQSIDVRVPADRLRVRIGKWLDYRRVAAAEPWRPRGSANGGDWDEERGIDAEVREGGGRRA